MAKPRKGKGRASGGGPGGQDTVGAAAAPEGASMQSGGGSMAGPADAGSRQSALPEEDLPIQSGGERIGIGHHHQGRQTGGLHQPSIADELAAESAPDQGTVAGGGKRKQ